MRQYAMASWEEDNISELGQSGLSCSYHVGDMLPEIQWFLSQNIFFTVVGGGKIHVVYLQFADSEEMAKTLNNFSQNSKQPTNTGFNPAGGFGVNPNESTLFEGQIKVASDKTTNSLVITASPADFATIQRVINKLDILRDQIYVEVVIMEMNMQRNNEFTANVVSGKTGSTVAPTSDLFNLIANPASAATQPA